MSNVMLTERQHAILEKLIWNEAFKILRKGGPKLVSDNNYLKELLDLRVILE